MVEYSEAEKAQAKVRLVRLDAEGNPVDGSAESYRLVHYVKNVYLDRIATLDDEILKTLETKRVSLKEVTLTLDESVLNILKGDSGDNPSVGDSITDPADR